MSANADLLRRADALLGTSGRNGQHDPSQAVPDQWDELTEIGEADLPEFPTDVLPDWQRDFVEELAEATQTPEDLPAMMVLDVTAASVARKVVVEVRDGWREPTNRYGVTALRSGERKTAVHQAAIEPIETYEAARALYDADEIARARTERKVAEQSLARAEKDAANAKPDQRVDKLRLAQAEAVELAKMTIPEPTCLLADDISPEKVAAVLDEQDGRLAIISDEGGIFDLMAGRYNDKGPNFDVFLKAHAGGTVRVKRVGRPDDFVPGAALTIGLAVQPSVIAGLAEHPTFRGKGLLARFAYALPASRVGNRRVNAAPVTARTRDTYHEWMTALLRLPLPDEPHVLRLGTEADAALAAFEEEIEPRLGEFGDLGHVADWAGKLAGLTARHAAHFHLADHATEPEPWSTDISLETVERAILLSRDYLVPHALAAFALMGADPDIADARYLLRWIGGRPEPTAPFTKREMYRAARGRFKQVGQIDRPLALLGQYGYVRKLADVESSDPAKSAGRKPSPVYEVNPSFSGQNGHYGQNRPRGDIKRDSVHSVQRHDVYLCAGCDRPRSRDAKPCPNCKETKGRMA